MIDSGKLVYEWESVLPVFLANGEVLLFVTKRFKIYFIAWQGKAGDKTKMLHLYWPV